MKVLSTLNGHAPGELNEAIRGKSIIDLGCGARPFWYDPNLAKDVVGIDSVPEAVADSARAFPNGRYHVRSVTEPLPFADRRFDVALLLFVLHHLPFAAWKGVLQEARRVASEIIIADHVRHDGIIRGGLQGLYWNTFDGGEAYLREEEWREVLRGYNVMSYRRTGRMFGNMCFYSLT